MAKYRIPRNLVPGFDEILKLDHDQVLKIAQGFKLTPVGSGEKVIADSIRSTVNLPSDVIQNISEVLFSFGYFLNNENPISSSSKDLSESFFLGHKKTDHKKADKEDLEKKILTFLEAGENLKITFKAIELQEENQLVVKGSRIISDIRLLFKDKMDEGNRYGLIIHQLRINATTSEQDEDIFLSLDYNDLLDLRNQIDRALEKHKIIMNDYKDISIINITD